VRRTYRRAVLAQMLPSRREEVGNALASGVSPQFFKVTKSYWKGLFFLCYRVRDLPRTNNELEHYFGSARYHQRRASGRKGASPAVVVRGCVGVVAAVATTPLEGFSALQIRPKDHQKWRTLRSSSLECRRETRRAQQRFRRDPEAYLAKLEEQLIKQALPA
jgi:hypothetical protein